jgi:hypothetical protein
MSVMYVLSEEEGVRGGGATSLQGARINIIFLMDEIDLVDCALTVNSPSSLTNISAVPLCKTRSIMCSGKVYLDCDLDWK